VVRETSRKTPRYLPKKDPRKPIIFSLINNLQPKFQKNLGFLLTGWSREVLRLV
jgi:hypothetical protein